MTESEVTMIDQTDPPEPADQQRSPFPDNDSIFEVNRQGDMYESLEAKLGKTTLELHKIIATL